MNPRSSTRKKKRPRYLSLRRRLAAASPPSISALDDPDQSQPFDLHEEDLSPFFPEEESVSLQSLLGSSSSSTRYEDPISPSSSSANYSAASSSLGGGVAAAALRGRAAAVEDRGPSAASRSLSLKLDYDGILTAWQDQWPLYVHEEAHQVVPETHHTAAPLYFSPVFIEVSQSDGGSTGQWTVPDGVGGSGGGGDKATEVREDRVARVMRYKEKRLRRLYNKRIRYEVRKLNAEKRPRLKGRFIRRDDD